MYKLIIGIAFGLLLSGNVAMATCSSYPYSLTNGTTADASQVMADFNCAALTSGATLVNVSQLGIGVSPTFVLDVEAGSTSGATLARFDSTTTGSGGAGIRISNTGTTEGWLGYGAFGGSGFGLSDIGLTARGALGLTAGSVTTPSIYINTSGNVGVGTTSPSYLLHVNGTAYATGAAGALSDIRHKKDVASLQGGAVDEVMRLRPVTFLWKDPKDNGMKGRQMGFIAQEVEQVLPTAVLTENNAEKTKGLKYNEITAVLTKALQEQQAEIVALKAANDNQVSEIGHLRTKLNVLEQQTRIRTAQR